MKKILYFEGAGCVPCNGVENCRIRTAFTNKEGKKIYIELFAGVKNTLIEYGKKGKKLKRPRWEKEDGFLWCDFCHYITDNENIDDCNYSRLSCERNTEERPKYTKENILKFVNENCSADFDEIVVLDNLAGFRVHSGKGKYNTSERYNYGDKFDYNEDLTRRRREKVEAMKKEFCELFGMKYDNTSYWIDDNGNLVVKINTYEEALKRANWTKGRQFIVEV